MTEREVKADRKTANYDSRKVEEAKQEIDELSNWLHYIYPARIEHIRRCKFLGVTPDELEYTLQREAHNKEQRLRKLTGKPPLDEPKVIDLFKGELK